MKMDTSLQWKAYLWGLTILVIPFFLYAERLVTDSLKDVPEAYLIWIPILGFFWMYWRMQHRQSNSTQSRPGWVSLAVVLLAGGLAFFGGDPASVSLKNLVLLLWPLWSLFSVWVLFGEEYVALVTLPALYLYLCWPPLFIRIINAMNPYLERWSYQALSWFSHGLSWIVTVSKMPVEFAVRDTHQWVAINVTASCSGSDSLLALLVLFPIVLIIFDISWWRKALIITLGCVVAFWANAVRIFIIFWVTHVAGVFWAFSVVHPLIGPVMFVLLVVVLLGYGGMRVTNQPTDTARIHPQRLPLALGIALGLAIVFVVIVSPFGG